MIKEKLWTKDYILLIIASFGSALLVSFFLNTLPVYAERISGSAVYAGLVTTVYSIAALCTRPVVGIIAEKIDRVKLVIIGLAMMTIACYSYTFAGAILILLILRAVHGIGFGVKSTASGVLVAEIIPTSRFAEGIGMFGLYLPVANAIGPALGLWIVGDASTEGFHFLFRIAGVIGVISIVIMFIIKADRRRDKTGSIDKGDICDEAETEENDLALPKSFMGFEFGVVYPSVVLALMYFGYAAIVSFLPIYGLSKGWSGVGVFYTIGAIALFVSRLIYSKLAKKYGYHIFVILSLVLFAGTLISIPLITSIYVLYIFSVFYGIAMGVVPMVVNTLVLERSSENRKGTATAAYTSAMDIGVGIGSIVLGSIVDAQGYTIAFVLSGIISLAALLIYMMTIMREDGKYNNAYH